MNVSDFEFDLPQALIAQDPPAERGASRLLWLHREDGSLTHSTFAALPERLGAGDLLVVNNTRVVPARLVGRRDPTGGGVEFMLIGRLDAAPPRDDGERWEALVHPGQKLKPGARVVFEGVHPLHGEVLERRGFGRRLVRLWTAGESTVDEAIEAIGHVPLPPYIRRGDRPADRDRYQTMYARAPGSVAAPTAGLHFTPELAAALAARGVQVAEITLHVGYGTFQPVRVEQVEAHRMEPERYDIGEAAAAAVTAAAAEGRRVVAVGTTTTRALESVALKHDGRIAAGAGWTDLFIYPGFTFRVVSGLVTNFHLPRSSLLMLVSAFGGRERVLHAYRGAVKEGYRFYSYGDAMLII